MPRVQGVQHLVTVPQSICKGVGRSLPHGHSELWGALTSPGGSDAMLPNLGPRGAQGDTVAFACMFLVAGDVEHLRMYFTDHA
jgi:hypothetical protein